MPGHDNAIKSLSPSSLPETSSINWQAKIEELIHEIAEDVCFSSFVTLGDFLYFNQGITPPCSMDGSVVHADAILTYIYDMRDISVGEWFAHENRYCPAASVLEFKEYETKQACKRLERLWAKVSQLRNLIRESGMTNNISCITYGHDSPQGSSEIVPVDLTFLYNLGKSKPFWSKPILLNQLLILLSNF